MSHDQAKRHLDKECRNYQSPANCDRAYIRMNDIYYLRRYIPSGYSVNYKYKPQSAFRSSRRFLCFRGCHKYKYMFRRRLNRSRNSRRKILRKSKHCLRLRRQGKNKLLCQPARPSRFSECGLFVCREALNCHINFLRTNIFIHGSPPNF